MLKIKALSIRQPWATLILRAGKDIENRNWCHRMRGGFLVHAAKGMTEDEWLSAIQFAHFTCGVSKDRLKAFCEQEHLDALRGGIVGYAEITDCISTQRHLSMRKEQQSPWFMGDYGFALANQTALPFLPMTGRLGFFEVEVPDDYIPAHLRARLAA